MPEPAGGFIDTQIANAVIAFADPRLDVGSIRPLIDAVLDSIDRDKLAQNLSVSARALLHGHQVMGAEATASPRLLARMRLNNELAHEARKKHPGMSYWEAIHAAHAITDAQVEDAIRKVQTQAGVSADGIADVWQWILTNWKVWLPGVLSILIFLL